LLFLLRLFYWLIAGLGILVGFGACVGGGFIKDYCLFIIVTCLIVVIDSVAYILLFIGLLYL